VLEPGLFELIEIGFFEGFWNWSNPILTLLIYLCVILGAAVQYILLKKCQKPVFRWAVIGLCTAGILISESALIFITGWDRLGIHFLYGFTLCILLGAVLMTGILQVKKKMQK